jgi:hypothetical protein
MIRVLLSPLILALAAVSPFRQRGSKGIIRGWLFNGYRRLAAQAPYWIVPFAIGAYHLLHSFINLLNGLQDMEHTPGPNVVTLGRTARLDILRWVAITEVSC